MKPFFSIRIDYNPADSDDQMHRDANTVRVAIARQCSPEAQRAEVGEASSPAALKAAALFEDRWSIVDAVTHALKFASRAMDGEGEWNLLDAVMKSLASVYGEEEAVRYLLEDVIGDTDDDYLDDLQAMIDKQRAALRDGTDGEPDA